MNDNKTKLLSRYSYLLSLKDGWLGGKGLAPTNEVLQLSYLTLYNYLIVEGKSKFFPYPKVYPTENGDIQAEIYDINFNFELFFYADGSKIRIEGDINSDDKEMYVELDAVDYKKVGDIVLDFLNGKQKELTTPQIFDKVANKELTVDKGAELLTELNFSFIADDTVNKELYKDMLINAKPKKHSDLFRFIVCFSSGVILTRVFFFILDTVGIK